MGEGLSFVRGSDSEGMEGTWREGSGSRGKRNTDGRNALVRNTKHESAGGGPDHGTGDLGHGGKEDEEMEEWKRRRRSSKGHGWSLLYHRYCASNKVTAVPGFPKESGDNRQSRRIDLPDSR